MTDIRARLRGAKAREKSRAVLQELREDPKLAESLAIVRAAMAGGGAGMNGQWQPIETAPRDGTAVLVMRDIWRGNPTGRATECNGHNTYVAKWWAAEGEDGAGRWICYMDMPADPECPVEPTHWMPLPEPPVAAEAPGDGDKPVDVVEHTLKLGAKHPFDAPDDYDPWRGDTPPPARDWAHAAARGVVADLCDRKGVKRGFEGIDQEVRAGLVDAIAALIRLAERHRGDPARWARLAAADLLR